MTYQELLALINPSNAYTVNQQVGGGSEGYTTVPTTVPGAYLMDPSNPMGGYVWDGGGGALSSVMPADGGGVNWTQYAPGGAVTGSGFSQDTSNWYDSLLGAAGTLGGAALGANLLGPLLGGGGAAAGAAGAAAPAAVGSSMTPAIGAAAAGAGAAETLPAVAGAAGAASAPSWSSILGPAGGAANSLLSNGGLLSAGLGALAGIAGNGDMNIGSTGTSNSTTTGTTQGSSSASTNSTGSQSLAPWLQGYAQDYVSRAQQLAGAPASNGAMDQGRGLLSNLAGGGDPLIAAARQQQQNVIGGGMLGANPYIGQVAGDIADYMGRGYATGTRAGTFSRFSADGNSPLAKSGFQQTLGQNDEAFTRALGGTLSNLFSGNYQQERAAQDNASRASLGFGQFDAGVGQSLYNMGSQDWQRPYFQNQQYGAAINPAFGSQTQNATNATGNTWNNVLQNTQGQTSQNQNIQGPSNALAGIGGAMAGYGLYRNIFGGR